MKPSTDCRCDSPGWCARHRMQKCDVLWHLCRFHPGHFRQWECGTGFGQTGPETPFQELMPCRRRSSQPVEFLDCMLCGGRTRKVAVYTCSVHGECTEHPLAARARTMRCATLCLTCPDYEALDRQSGDPA